MDDLNVNKVISIKRLIDIARGLGPAEMGLPRQDGAEHSDKLAAYVGGIVDLLVNAADLSTSSVDAMTEAVSEPPPSQTGLSEADLDMTMRATFLPKPDRYSPELPVIEIGGILVFVYIKDQQLRVSVSLDTTDEALMHGPDHLVPMQIDVGDTTVFEA